MHSHFFFSTGFLLLFKEWKIDNDGALTGAFFGLFVFQFLSEILRYFETRWFRQRDVVSRNGDRSLPKNVDYGSCERHNEVPSIASSRENTITNVFAHNVYVKNVFTTLRLFNSFIILPSLVAANYFVMLAVMTYNVWLLLAVCTASGLSYFISQTDIDLPRRNTSASK